MAFINKWFRFKSIEKRRVLQYIAYAFGEILLIVIGILIALQINNKNEAVKTAQQLNGILNSISYDLAQDTLMLSQTIKYYESREEIATKIITDSMSDEALRSCLVCTSLVSTYVPFTINDKGYLQLKNYNNNIIERDSLSTDIVQFYTAFIPLLTEFQEEVKQFTLDNIAEWRDTKPWFASIMSNQPDPRFFEYLTTQDYRNKVAYYNVIACKNYLTFLKQYKLNATEVLRRLDVRREATEKS